MRPVLAVVVGAVATVALYWLGAVGALLAMRGIPLGSAGGPPTGTELAVHLLLGSAATFLGALAAIRMAGTSIRAAAGAVGLLIAIGAAAAFSKPTSEWPPWFGIAMAGSCLAGAWVAVNWKRRRR